MVISISEYILLIIPATAFVLHFFFLTMVILLAKNDHSKEVMVVV